MESMLRHHHLLVSKQYAMLLYTSKPRTDDEGNDRCLLGGAISGTGGATGSSEMMRLSKGVAAGHLAMCYCRSIFPSIELCQEGHPVVQNTHTPHSGALCDFFSSYIKSDCQHTNRITVFIMSTNNSISWYGNNKSVRIRS